MIRTGKRVIIRPGSSGFDGLEGVIETSIERIDHPEKSTYGVRLEAQDELDESLCRQTGHWLPSFAIFKSRLTWFAESEVLELTEADSVTCQGDDEGVTRPEIEGPTGSDGKPMSDRVMGPFGWVSW